MLFSLEQCFLAILRWVDFNFQNSPRQGQDGGGDSGSRTPHILQMPKLTNTGLEESGKDL